MISRPMAGRGGGTLDDDRLDVIIEELPADDQIEILVGLQAERAADVLEAMEPDDAATCSPGVAPGAPGGAPEMDQDEAEDLRRLLTTTMTRRAV